MANKPALIKCFLFGFVISVCGIAATATAVTISVPEDFNDIQAAIDDSNDGDIIDVNDGIYTGPGNYNIDTKGLEITVKSRYGAYNCIIDCDNKGRAFLIQNGEDSDTVIEGFAIINGYAEDPNWPRDVNDANAMDNPDGYGGAIYCIGSSPDINNCIIMANWADYGGGAIFCDVNSNPSIMHCEISYNYCGSYHYDVNQMGGGIYCRKAGLRMDDCDVIHNEADGMGGGIACEDSNAVITNCRIEDNECYAYNDDVYQHGGGIYCKGGSTEIIKCTINGNKANDSGGGIAVLGGTAVFDSNDANDISGVVWIASCEIINNDSWASGGGIYTEGDCSPLITNCVVANNWGYWSGGISITDSEPNSFVAIENCTIAHNKVPYQELVFLTGGLECWAGPDTRMGNATVTNSIIWGNKGFQITGIDANDAVTYSDVQMFDTNGLYDPYDLWPGEGNINEDPYFAYPLLRDYHLQTEEPNGRYNPYTGVFDVNDPVTSLCINAGEPLYSDFSLEPEENGDRINMGAYGGTEQASKSDQGPPGVTVNMFDFAILANNWLSIVTPGTDGDFSGDGFVDEQDLLILIKFWLW